VSTTGASTVDAVVVGAGHHGLVAANVLADQGWDVLIVEAAPVPGGAVRSGPLTVPGFHHDYFSGFYPLAFVSPALVALHLEDYGLHWQRAPVTLAHPTCDGPAAVIGADVEVTAVSLDRFACGDGDAWRHLYDEWLDLAPDLIRSLLSPFPPVRAGGRLAAGVLGRSGWRGLAELARTALLPARRLAEERFAGEGAALVLAGCALHADLVLEGAGSGLYGWVLCMLAQQVGFPVPRGGAGALTDALVRRFEDAGGHLRCATPVEAVEVCDGRVRGVRTAGGERLLARRAVIADVDAPQLYLRLLAPRHLPSSVLAAARRFEWDPPTVKLDWALRSPIPWTDPACRRAGTIHLGDDLDHLSDVAHALATRRRPVRPFVIVGQHALADPTRMPPGAETAWAYAHLPPPRPGEVRNADDTESLATLVAGEVEAEIERWAPGFAERVVGRNVLTPRAMGEANPGLATGAVGGGSAQLHQSLVFRPIPGLGRAETPISGLYLASASAHPGGGVHGACGANAARAALAHARLSIPRPIRKRGSHD
jgi:phytoene dehydrogenase-like protein